MAKSYLNIPSLPIGLRNNNPGNVRPVPLPDKWKGQIGINQNFSVFENVAWGIRAMAMDIRGDINEGKNTIRKLISEYSSTDQIPYINYVAMNLNMSPDQTIVASDPVLFSIMRQMINFELGPGYTGYITNDDINEGISLLHGGGIIGPAGFSIAAVLLLFAIGLLATMPPNKRAKLLNV